MKLKRILWVVVGLVTLGIGVYSIQGRRAQSEVDRLIGQAHGRGLRTELNAVVLRQYVGERQLARLAGLESRRDLRSLKFDSSNVQEARGLIASADRYFAPIAEFANMKVYSPRRDFHSGTSFEDYSTLFAAVQLEGWRGYLLAEDNKLADAIASIEVLKGLMARLHDEKFQIGNAIAYKAQRWISRIALRLAEQSADAAAVERIQAAVSSLPEHDFKGSLSWELAGDLAYLDEIEIGKYAPPPVYLFNIQFRVARTPAHLNAVRAAVLKAVIRGFDEWDSAPLEIVSSHEFQFIEDDLERSILQSIAQAVDWQRRDERNDLADRRALALTLAAYQHRVATGKLPTVAELERAGQNATDPWDGNKMTLHQDGDRIWVGALRPNPKALEPKPEVTDVLIWRP